MAGPAPGGPDKPDNPDIPDTPKSSEPFVPHHARELPENPTPRQELTEKVADALRTCYDPEIPVNIYELGLIYEIKIDDENNVAFDMTLTSPACPVAGTLPGEAEARIREVEGVKSAKVTLTWDPTWTMEMLSDVARVQLNM